MKKQRLVSAAEAMKEQGLDAVVFGIGANFQYLLECNDYYWQRSMMTNISGRSSAYLHPEVLLYMDKDREYTVITNGHNAEYFTSRYPGHVIVSYMDQFEDAIAPLIGPGRIGVGISSQEYITEMLKGVDPQLEVVFAEDLLKDIRCIKDADEIEALRKVAAFTDEAVMHVVKNLKEGITQREAENMIIQYGLDHGIEDLSFPPTIGFKTQGTITTDTVDYYDRNWKLQPNTGIAFDIGYMNGGYCSDWGRSLYFGKAPQFVKDAYSALQAGQQFMVQSIKPYETNNSELYGFVLQKVTELGFSDVLRFKEMQMLGHQIGIDCHEFPMVNKASDFVMKPGMVFASEPKMWIQDEMYMRVEDIILVTEDGAEFLTNFPRDMFEI